MFPGIFSLIITSTLTVYTASGINHLWHQPAATEVINTRCCIYSQSAPDDERKYRSKHVELTKKNELSDTVASCWVFS